MEHVACSLWVEPKHGLSCECLILRCDSSVMAMGLANEYNLMYGGDGKQLRFRRQVQGVLKARTAAGDVILIIPRRA